MSRQNLYLNRYLQAGKDVGFLTTVKNGIQAWSSLNNFLRTTCEEVCRLSRENVANNSQDELEHHKA